MTSYGFTAFPRPFVMVKAQRDAEWAYCRNCDAVITGNQYWSWKKSMGLHRLGNGAGHRIELYRLA